MINGLDFINFDGNGIFEKKDKLMSDPLFIQKIET